MLTRQAEVAPVVTAPADRQEVPPRVGLWALFVAMGASYPLWQFLVMLPSLVWLWSAGQIHRLQEPLDSPAVILAALASLGMSALVTILVAATWPSVWRAVIAVDGPSFAGWFGWRAIRTVPVWAIPFMTFAVQMAILVAILPLIDPNDVNPQKKLFATPEAQILGLLIVTTLVPVAEELIFRGALYNALLGRDGSQPEWRRSIAPVIITSVVFAAIHRLAGINTLAGLLQITLMSFYLGGLRFVTGSVKSTVIAHMTWNAVGALAFIAASSQV